MELKKALNQKAPLKIAWVKRNLVALNKEFRFLTLKERIETLYKLFPKQEILLTSSFGTKSAVLLDLIHNSNVKQEVYFINTGYLFDETLKYKAELQKKYRLTVHEVIPHEGQHSLTKEEKWWEYHPRMCCTINKIAPLDSVISEHSIWISGLMGFQTDWRSNLDIFEKRGDIIKFHPLIDISKDEFLSLKNKLPQHPLEIQGFGSVGCKHCTVKGKDRSGRWRQTSQNECGLHVNFYYKK